MTFDYHNATMDDLDERAMQLLIFDTKEITAIVKGHLFIERILDQLIDSKLDHPQYLRKNHRLTFELKVDLARALGVLPETGISPIKTLNSIRNKYAHDENYQVSFSELRGLKHQWELIQEKAFQGACAKGIEDAALIATLFLTWSCMKLL